MSGFPQSVLLFLLDESCFSSPVYIFLSHEGNHLTNFLTSFFRSAFRCSMIQSLPSLHFLLLSYPYVTRRFLLFVGGEDVGYRSFIVLLSAISFLSLRRWNAQCSSLGWPNRFSFVTMPVVFFNPTRPSCWARFSAMCS